MDVYKKDTLKYNIFYNLGLKKRLRDKSYLWGVDSGIFTYEDIVNTAITSQMNIGWYNLLCGFISNGLADLKRDYLVDINSRLSITRWASNLSIILWNIVHQLWKHRNDALHNLESIHLLSGLEQLKNSITTEIEIGLATLPTVYSSYFRIPLARLLGKSPAYLKRWFLVIRSSREALSIRVDMDVFSFDGILRSWVGLPSLQ